MDVEDLAPGEAPASPGAAASYRSERHCRALLTASGVSWRRPDVPDIDWFRGGGVYYGGGRMAVLAIHQYRSTG